MISYQPDNTELGHEILVSVAQLLPNTDGSYRTPYAAVASSFDGLNGINGDPLNAFFAQKPDGTSRLFVGVTARLYEITSGTTWTDRTAGASDYATGVSWHFTQYGTQTLASNKANVIQQSSSGDFAALSNAPKAYAIDTLEGAVAAWNVDDGADKPDTLMISDVDNNTVWTPADDNLAYTTQLTDCPGGGTALIRYRDFFVIFKARGMWIAAPSFGSGLKWDVRLYSADVGCVGKDACIVAGDTLYFVDDNGAWSFDGATIRSISDPFVTRSLVRDFVATAGNDISRTELHYDDVNKLLSIYPASASSGSKDHFWAYNVVSRQWGRGYAYTVVSETNLGTRCMIRAPFKALTGFSGSGVTESANENRFHVRLSSTSVAYTIRNGHGMAVAGSAVSAYFGAWKQAQSASAVYMNADDNTGVTVSVQTKRSPRSGGTTQATSDTVAVSADMKADVRADGNFHKVTFTLATTAVFTKWSGYETDMTLTGKR